MNKTACFGVALAGLLLGCLPVSALIPSKAVAQFTSTTWTQSEGLPVDTVRSIAQTADGFLWIGTDEGLARFDGHEFTVFGAANGALPSDFVATLASSRDGSLWIGTQEGLVHYANGKFTRWGTAQGLPHPNITALHEDRNSTLWVAAGGALCTIQNGVLKVIPAEKLGPLALAHAFFEDKQGRLWISGAGLIRRDGDVFVPVLTPKQMGGLIANVLVDDRQDTLWIGTSQGVLARTTEGKLLRFDTPDRIPNRLVRALWVDRDGVLWAGTNGGLLRFENDRFTIQPVSPSHERISIRALLEDREGDLWMGSGIGLSRLRNGRFTSYGPPEGLPADEPNTVLADGKGNLWVGYNASGLLQLSVSPSSVVSSRLFTVRDGLISNEVSSVRQAANGDLLIATRAGLSRMHDGRFENMAIVESLQRLLLLDVLEEGPLKGQPPRLLVATSQSVRIKEGANWRTLMAGGPLALEEGAGGVVWVGTYAAGLWRINPDGSVHQFTKADGLGTNRIRTLRSDEHGVLWIGTVGAGLVRFDGKHFFNFTTGVGLPSDNVTHIASDGAGELWISTTRGIARVAESDLEAVSQGRLNTLPVVTYGPDDGLRSLQAGPTPPLAAGGTQSPDGRLWFITGQSLAVTDPRLADPPELLTTVVEASADGKPLDAVGQARIQPDAGPLVLRFAGLHLRAPEQVRYEYRLAGLDKQWSAPTNLRSVTYSRLPHGEYRFQVRALLPGQSFPEASFAFVVLPRFYETPWFMLLCVVAIAAAIYGAFQWRQRQIHSRFALVIAERTRLAREIHDTLAQGFFGISSQLDAMSLKLDDPEAVRRDLNLARRMARHSLADARRSVMDLRTSVLEDCDLRDALASSAPQWIEGSPIELVLKLGQTGGLGQDVEQNVLRIAQEAVVNAMKHARPSSIGIDLDFEPKRLTLRVRDNGCGFDATRSFTASEGHFGLIGMLERARAIGGEVQVISCPGQGTTVEVMVPV